MQVFAGNLLSAAGLGEPCELEIEFGSKAVDQLVHVSPDLALATLDRVLRPLSIDELREIGPGRRHIVWALEKLAFRRASFERAARLLLLLRRCRDGRMGNNATGQFKQLFQLFLSGTEAEPALRLGILDEGLRSNDLRRKTLCVDALGEMLSTHGYTRSGGAEVIGTQRPLQDWRPEFVRDQWQFFREALTRLTNLALGSSDLAARAKAILGQHVRGLFQVLPFDDVAGMIRQIVGALGFWIDGLRGVNTWLYFDLVGASRDRTPSTSPARRTHANRHH